jgi:hypothetical protein
MLVRQAVEEMAAKFDDEELLFVSPGVFVKKNCFSLSPTL